MIGIGTKYEFCKWLSKTVPGCKPVFLEGGEVLEDGIVHYSALVKSTEPEWMEVDWCKEAGFWNFLIFDKAEILFNLSQHQGLFKCQFFASGGQSTGVSASASVLQ